MDLWIFRDASYGEGSLEGFEVAAEDGGIGRVEDVSREAGASSLVVDTGVWIFGRRVLLPAGVVTEVDREHRRVHVACTKEQVRNAPEYDLQAGADDAYRRRLAGHYAGA
jgi:3'-phosphoadenosine 5'-phosphosulfate sulfotransferase